MTDTYRPPDRRPAERAFEPGSHRPSYSHGPSGRDHDRAYRPPNGRQNSGSNGEPPSRYAQNQLPPHPGTRPQKPRLGQHQASAPPPPPGGPYQPPPPSYPPPPMRRFGEDRGGNDRYPNSRNDFSFRVNDRDAPRYPDNPRDLRDPRGPPRGPRKDNSRRPGGRGPQRPNNRPFRPKPPTSNRPLLRFQRGNTPEQLEGMIDTQANTTYRDINDISDSDEQPMEESDEEGEDPEQIEAKANKRVKVTQEAEDEVPKWSNPELYTALPPIEDATERKRRDVVKLIRKARVAAEKAAEKPANLGGDDFISLDFTDKAASIDDEDAAPYSPEDLHNEQLATANAIPLPIQHNTLAVELSVVQTLAIDDNKRKRESDDEGIHLTAPRHKTGRGAITNALVVAEWRESKSMDPTPWIKDSHTRTENCGFRLHKEICDFYEFVRPRPFEQKMREELLERIQSFVTRESQGTCRVYPFGSFAAGLYLPNADMDVVVCSDEYLSTGEKVFAQSKKLMYRFSRALTASKLATHSSLTVIATARVPLIKFVDPVTQLQVDLSFENDTGIIANRTFGKWKAQFPAMPILVTIIKQYLMMRGLNNVANGGIGGFSVTCLVTSLLQNLPRIQMGELCPELHLGEMFLEFLDFYGNQLDITRTALRMEPPGFVDKENIPDIDLNFPNKRGRLCIIDPNTPSNDISGGTKEISLILRQFAIARDNLLGVMQCADEHTSLLRCCLGGNYNDFLWHRWQLRQLFERKYGPVPHELDGE